ncbi:hypothetical protein GCM10017673_44980 [Streptosporangium violaceochromogenes]|nr:hypothetical protein GCM10017673_44980 [Streptosporangium violaceochromogenes]
MMSSILNIPRDVDRRGRPTGGHPARDIRPGTSNREASGRKGVTARRTGPRVCTEFGSSAGLKASGPTMTPRGRRLAR